MTSALAHPALRDAEHKPFWLDRPGPRQPVNDPLTGSGHCDLAVVGGGYTGRWTALLAKERDPSLDVVVLEARELGWAASGRNGGFCSSTLTHGTANGVQRFGEETHVLEKLGQQNLDEIGETVHRYGMDCDWDRAGELLVATQPHQVAELTEAAELAERYGAVVKTLDAEAVREQVHSPTYLGALEEPEGTAMVDPAKLVRGLRDACLSLGVRIHENSPVTAMSSRGAGMEVRTPAGALRAGRVALATNVFPSLLRRLRWYLIPVYDYALVTEPLSAAQLESVGWQRRQGVSETANQFHYYRLTPDNRILWGGYDAIYHYGSRMEPALEQRAKTTTQLARNFFGTFPQLDGLRFTHHWGGVIDTCTRFSPFFGSTHRGKVAYAAGYTGLGVGASRFAARVMLGQLYGCDPDIAALSMVRRRPLPFPPEPLRYAGVQLTRLSMARADRSEGRRNLWLKVMDKLGLGFGS